MARRLHFCFVSPSRGDRFSLRNQSNAKRKRWLSRKLSKLRSCRSRNFGFSSFQVSIEIIEDRFERGAYIDCIVQLFHFNWQKRTETLRYIRKRNKWQWPWLNLNANRIGIGSRSGDHTILLLFAKLWIDRMQTKQRLKTYFRLSHVTGTDLQHTVFIMLPAAVIQGHNYYVLRRFLLGQVRNSRWSTGSVPKCLLNPEAKTQQTCVCALAPLCRRDYRVLSNAQSPHFHIHVYIHYSIIKCCIAKIWKHWICSTICLSLCRTVGAFLFCHPRSTNTNKLVQNDLNFTRLRNICIDSLAINRSMKDLFWICSNFPIFNDFVFLYVYRNKYGFHIPLFRRKNDGMRTEDRVLRAVLKLPFCRRCVGESWFSVSTCILQIWNCVRVIVWTCVQRTRLIVQRTRWLTNEGIRMHFFFCFAVIATGSWCNAFTLEHRTKEKKHISVFRVAPCALLIIPAMPASIR